jgi:hypothetical protein
LTYKAVYFCAQLLYRCAGARVVHQAYEARVTADAISEVVFVPHPLLCGFLKLERCNQHYWLCIDLIQGLLCEVVDVQEGLVESAPSYVHDHCSLEDVLELVRAFGDNWVLECLSHASYETGAKLLTGRKLTIQISPCEDCSPL